MRMVVAVAAISVGVSAASYAGARDLTFEDRVAAQKAIEQVYWKHRIWPKENSRGKPSLSAVMSDEAIRAKVEDYLKKSNALATVWHRPITKESLQAEMDRMAKDSRDPNMLRELFATLGNDPIVIAETLARQALSDQLVRGFFASDDRVHGELRRRVESSVAACRTVDCLKSLGGEYREIVLKLRTEPDDLSEPRPGDPAETVDASMWKVQLAILSQRFGETPESLPLGKLSGLEETPEAFIVSAVLAQGPRDVTTAIVVWRKTDFDSWWGTQRTALDSQVTATSGALLIPSTTDARCVNDSWRPTSTGANVPQARYSHSAVWTGAEMIVWGGAYQVNLNSGGRYDPATDSWTPTSTGANTPEARYDHTAVWTGTEMIIWGGEREFNSPLNTGGRYDPVIDRWKATSTGPTVPAKGSGQSAVWTGTEMIVWGGQYGTPRNTGGRYNPVTDSWTPTVTDGSTPVKRWYHSAAWTGTEMIVWGGYDGYRFFNTGGRYDPSTDRWRATRASGNVPAARELHTTVWTGREMIAWGGYGSSIYHTNTGGRYNPSTDEWSATSTGINLPHGRAYHTAVWTGREMIVWGGYGGVNESSGGRYDPETDQWTLTSTGQGVPEGRFHHSAVWTGAEMIVWGGSDSVSLKTGGLYCACPNASTAYRDADGDRFGDPALSIPTCDGSAPPGYVLDATDCNDANPNVHPNAAEECNGIDDNCDGTVDNGGDALCNDENACTNDSCNGASRCEHSDNASPCDDGDACTTGDTCGGGSCNPGAPRVCDDGNACNGVETCRLATGCVAGTPPHCDDQNVCTDDACNPMAGCVHSSNTASCDDGNACTVSDVCSGGSCQPGAPVVCNDNNVCTTDTCNPVSGCVYTNNNNPCDDHDACTTVDICSNGVCIGGQPTVCSALDQCHVAGVCDSIGGTCSNPNKPDGTTCDDSSLCTTGETCQAGTCTPASSGLNHPIPRSSGYYHQLCEKAEHGQVPYHGDQITDADAVCVASLTAEFSGFQTAADLCAVIDDDGAREHQHPGGHDPYSHECFKAEDEIIATALNICRARVCEAQNVDSRCGADDHHVVETSVGESFADANTIVDDPNRTKDLCKQASCELKEINNGHALEMNSVVLVVEVQDVRLSWLAMDLEDGTGMPNKYEVWRRPLNSSSSFAKIGETTTALTYLDTTGGTGSWEYEVTADIP